MFKLLILLLIGKQFSGRFESSIQNHVIQITFVSLGELVMVAVLLIAPELLVIHLSLDYCHWLLFVVLVVEEVCQSHSELMVVVDSMAAMALFSLQYFGSGWPYSICLDLRPNHKRSPTAMVAVDLVVLECTERI